MPLPAENRWNVMGKGTINQQIYPVHVALVYRCWLWGHTCLWMQPQQRDFGLTTTWLVENVPAGCALLAILTAPVVDLYLDLRCYLECCKTDCRRQSIIGILCSQSHIVGLNVSYPSCVFLNAFQHLCLRKVKQIRVNERAASSWRSQGSSHRFDQANQAANASRHCASTAKVARSADQIRLWSTKQHLPYRMLMKVVEGSHVQPGLTEQGRRRVLYRIRPLPAPNRSVSCASATVQDIDCRIIEKAERTGMGGSQTDQGDADQCNASGCP